MMLLWTKWSQNDVAGSPRAEELLQNRRNLLFSRFTFLGLIIILVHIGQDAVQGLAKAAVFDCVIGLVILVAHIANRRGHHMASKTSLLFLLNISLTIYCSLAPKHNGIFLFFFPLIGLSSVVFDYTHRSWGFFFVGLSCMLLVALVLCDFKLLGDVSIPSTPERNSFLINLTSSSLVLMVCINFMMRYNDESERRLVKLAEEVGQQNKRLEKTNSELDRFVYSASHDLRAPLLSIQGIVNIAQYENSNPAVREYLTMINGQVIKLDTFIRDIINYSHNSRTEVIEQRVNFSQLVECVRENLTFMKGIEKITWEKEIDDQLEWVTDKSRIVTVLNNLISNAIKFHNFSREDPWIKIAVEKNCIGCSITVRDNGIGIPPEHQHRVFDMFYRAHDNSSGSGLGLYIVKEIVAKMKGSVHLQSQVGHGSAFIVTLPDLAA